MACIVSRLDSVAALACARRVAELFKRRAWRVVAEYNMTRVVNVSFDGVFVVDALPECDMLIVVGGDGTLLRVVSSIPGDYEGVVIGVRMGRRGFLTGFECSDKDLDLVARGKYARCVVNRICGVRRSDGYRLPPALNEVAVIASRGKTIAVKVRVEDDVVMNVRGDGVIVSTVPGSYAYSASAGGPTILGGVEAIVVTPLNSMTSVRPIVIPTRARLLIEAVEGYRAAWVFVDGQFSTTLALGDAVEIRVCNPIVIGYKSTCPWIR